MSRYDRQKAIYQWVLTALGVDAAKPFERVLRVVEETLELAQSVGVGRGQIIRILDHVYSRPAGRMDIEAGDVGVSLIAFCESIKLEADNLEAIRAEYALALDPEVLAKRVQEKVDAGIAHGVCSLCGKQRASSLEESVHNTGECGCDNSRGLCWRNYCGRCESIYDPANAEEGLKNVCQAGGFVCRLCNRTLEQATHEPDGSYSCLGGCGKWKST